MIPWGHGMVVSASNARCVERHHYSSVVTRIGVIGTVNNPYTTMGRSGERYPSGQCHAREGARSFPYQVAPRGARLTRASGGIAHKPTEDRDGKRRTPCW